MFEPKSLDFGFVVLSPEPEVRSLKNTLRSIYLSYPEYPFITVASNVVPTDKLNEMKKLCNKVIKGKGTITSLLNTGLRNAPAEWVIFVCAGTWVKRKVCKNLSRFIDDDTDVVYPIVEGVYKWKDCSLNGICINKKMIKKVGPFPEDGDLDRCKEFWALMATATCQSKFKAILGGSVD
jgi:hypothetical protein